MKQQAYVNLPDGYQTAGQKRSLPLSDATREASSSPKTRDSGWAAGEKYPAGSTNLPDGENHSHWHYPPEFWDRLSKVPLIHSALEELERRNRAQPVFTPPPPPTTGVFQDLARFSRHGGPDLCNLRGYPAPVITKQHLTCTMRSLSRSQPTPATVEKPESTQKSSPYNRGFSQHLTDYGIHTSLTSQKPNLDEIRAALIAPRPSLSLSHFSEDAFEAFQETTDQANDERDVLEHVFPSISGPPRDNYPSTRNVVFGNLQPLTDGTITAPQPDIALGTLPGQLNPAIRNELQYHIIPSTTTDRIMLPNFFAEAKGPDGAPSVMVRQARYDGAVGTRAMHAIQNYGREEPVYDGKAYTYSATYQNGQLQLYAHHLTTPATAGERPEYHMNQLKAYALTNDRETFVQGATAYRNLRDLAKQHRDIFIQDANSRYQVRDAAAKEAGEDV